MTSAIDNRDTQVWTVDGGDPDEQAIDAAAAIIGDGGLVAFPTETVYGLGADALSEEAVGGIFRAKGRPATNPLIVHVDRLERAQRLASRWPKRARRLAEAFWPGSLTLVVERAPIVPDAVCAGLDTVALRMPAHPVARRLIEVADRPIAAPSANRYTEVSPTSAQHVLKGLGGRIDAVIDAGRTDVGLESTLVSVVETPATLLRPGMIDIEQLADCIDIEASTRTVVDEEQVRPSPGMSEKHYSPGRPLHLVDRQSFDRMGIDSGDGRRRGMIGLCPQRWDLPAESDHAVIWLHDDADAYAAQLYSAMHRLDTGDIDEIVVEAPPDTPRWQAVKDRLRRAATPTLSK